MKKIIITIVILAIAGAAAWALLRGKESGDVSYEYSIIERGDIESIVSCTGELQATSAVDVSTEVSGTIDAVLVDYNDIVTIDQPLAIIDTTQLVLTMRSREASLKKAKADLTVAQLDYESNQELHEKGFLSDYELAVSESSLLAAEASYISAETNYEQTLNDLRIYSIIRSPINGSVIDKQVETGSTVQASYSSPTLFTIAEDLANMEILAYLDESDIGLVEEGMEARFTVDAYPENEYEGEIIQIRLQPETVSNVVNYIVVVSAENPNGELLPGMTATVDFIAEKVEDTLMASASALSFQPDMATIQSVMERKRAEHENSSQNPGRPPSGQDGEMSGPPPQGAGGSEDERAMLWYVNDDGDIDMTPVRTGLTDGAHTQISGPEVYEGMQIITKQNGEVKSDESQQNGLFTMPGPPGSRRNSGSGGGGPR